jgi:hypothetical protein
MALFTAPVRARRSGGSVRDLERHIVANLNVSAAVELLGVSANASVTC